MTTQPGEVRLVNGILRGIRRRGLPANIDPDDLRQEGMIALIGQGGSDALRASIARNAMVYALRKGLLGNKRYFTGQAVADDSVRPRRAIDPVAFLDAAALESRHREWERERAEHWA